MTKWRTKEVSLHIYVPLFVWWLGRESGTIYLHKLHFYNVDTPSSFRSNAPKYKVTDYLYNMFLYIQSQVLTIILPLPIRKQYLSIFVVCGCITEKCKKKCIIANIDTLVRPMLYSSSIFC